MPILLVLAIVIVLADGRSGLGRLLLGLFKGVVTVYLTFMLIGVFCGAFVLYRVITILGIFK